MRNHPAKRDARGFSTLLLVIVLGAAALSLTLALSMGSFWSIRGSIDAKISSQAKALANACAEVALEAMRESNAYDGGESLSLDGGTCTYDVSNTGGASRRVEVSAEVGDIVRNITVTTSSFNPLVVSSWQEVP